MSIVVDYNGVALANLHTNAAVRNGEIDENFLRHLILNSLRGINAKHKKKYGQLIVAADARSWRKDVFKEYKASRKKGREESSIDWDDVFRMLNLFFEEIQKNIPFICVKVDGAEADDIIGCIAARSQKKEHNEPLLIVSNDKDFIQLQKYDNVKQFAPVKGKMLEHSKPDLYLKEHILRGDAGDGVPNILSDDDTFVVPSKSQSPLRSTKVNDYIQEWDNLKTVMPEYEYRNFQRNRKMVDLDYCPKEIWDQINKILDEYKLPPNMKVMNYLVKNRCKNLIGSIEDFFPTKIVNSGTATLF